jgi:hypothetical protein
MDISENGYLTEANLLAAGLNEIDFGTIWSDWVKSTEDFLDITNATYRIVIGEGETDPLKLNNSIAVAFVNAFEEGVIQTPTVLGDVVLSGSQPTFTWSHTNSIGKAYPMFQLRIWEKDGAKELVFDSGKIRAPARDANGLYKWTAPVYDGMLTAEGKTFFTASNYTWSVSMLDAKFSEPWDYEDGVAKRWTGLGNSVYLSDVTFLPQLLSMLSSKEGDIVIYNGDTVIRDYSIMDGILSTSEEDCPLSFYNRKFLPKTREE